MAEFCKCGSIILSDKCTNKNCAFKTDKGLTGTSTTKKTSAGKTKADKSSKTSTSTRRSSRCVTYSINELEEREPKYKNNRNSDDYFGDENEEKEVDEDEEKYFDDEDDT